MLSSKTNMRYSKKNVQKKPSVSVLIRLYDYYEIEAENEKWIT